MLFIAIILKIEAQYKMQIWVSGSPLSLPTSVIDSVTFLNNDITEDIPDIPQPDPNPDPNTANGIGVFSVANNKTVSFAPGNLQFNATLGSHFRADSTIGKGTWRFAENQWDYIGENNANISENYDSWIDLFGWGTSGYDNTEKDPLAQNFMPWSNGRQLNLKIDSVLNCDAYEITGECVWEYTYLDDEYNKYGYGPSTNMTSKGLYGTSANYDWGIYNAISNGGNEAGLWRTLTKAEWEYLLNTRSNAQYLHSQATVNNICGYILLPDNFKKPSNINWTPLANDYTTNTYTIEEWSILEEIGAIFLPASGLRNSSILNIGHYWSATQNFCDYSTSSLYAVYFKFDSSNAEVYRYPYDNHRNEGARSSGRSVRLVKDL